MLLRFVSVPKKQCIKEYFQAKVKKTSIKSKTILFLSFLRLPLAPIVLENLVDGDDNGWHETVVGSTKLYGTKRAIVVKGLLDFSTCNPATIVPSSNNEVIPPLLEGSTTSCVRNGVTTVQMADVSFSMTQVVLTRFDKALILVQMLTSSMGLMDMET